MISIPECVTNRFLWVCQMVKNAKMEQDIEPLREQPRTVEITAYHGEFWMPPNGFIKVLRARVATRHRRT